MEGREPESTAGSQNVGRRRVRQDRASQAADQRPAVAPDVSATALVEHLRSEVQFLRAEVERKDAIITHLTQRIELLPHAGYPPQPPPSRPNRVVAYKASLLVDAAAFRRLDQMLAQVHPQRRYLVATADNQNTPVTDVEAFLSFAEAKAAPIVSLTIMTPEASQHDRGLAINMQSGERAPTFQYAVYGDESDLFHLSGRVEEWLTSVKPWYAWLAGRAVNALTISMFAWGVSMIVLASLTINSPALGSDQKTATLPPWFFIPLFVLLPVRSVWARMFPLAIFAVGLGARKADAAKTWRVTVGTGVILALVVSLVAGYIQASPLLPGH